MKTLEEILQTEYSPEFEAKVRQELARFGGNEEAVGRFFSLMQNAMILSFHKYGALVDGYPDKVSATESLLKRLDFYVNGGRRGDVVIKPGNTEWLVDVANFAMIEYMLPSPGETAAMKDEFNPVTNTGGILVYVNQYAKHKDPQDLVYLAAIAAREFIEPQHKKAHFKGLDSSASPGRFLVEDEIFHQGANVDV